MHYKRRRIDDVKVVLLGQDPYHGAESSTWTKFFGTTGCKASTKSYEIC